MDKLMELGSRLKEQRRSLGLEREEIAIKIKVSAKTLHALEEAIVDSFPQPVFSRGFARSYAEAMGMNMDEMNQLITAAFPSDLINNINPELSATAREQAITINQPSNSKPMMLAIPLLIAALALVGWFVYRSFAPGIMDAMQSPPPVTQQSAPVRPAPVQPVEEAPAPAEEQTAEELQPSAGPVQTAQAQAAQASAQSAQPAPQPEASVVNLPANHVPQSNARADSPIPAGMKRVSLFAKYECWVGAEFDVSGRRSFTLEAGQTFVLDFRDNLTLTLGNSGAIDMSYNGQPYNINGRFREAKVLHFPPR